MHQRRDAWEYLDALGVDIALVQEAVPPTDERPRGWKSVPAHDEPDLSWIDRSRRWAKRDRLLRPPLNELPTARLGDPLPADGYWVSHPGALQVAEMGIPDRPVLIASVYGLLVDKFAITSVNRHLSDLTPLVYSGRWKQIVVGGDLKITPQFPAPWGRHHKLVIDRFEALGFENCLGRYHDDYQQTFFRKNASPYQDDWIFARARHDSNMRTKLP